MVVAVAVTVKVIEIVMAIVIAPVAAKGRCGSDITGQNGGGAEK